MPKTGSTLMALALLAGLAGCESSLVGPEAATAPGQDLVPLLAPDGAPEYANVMNQNGVGVYSANGARLVRQPNGLSMSMTMPTPAPGDYVYADGKRKKIWRCTSYADLQYAEINNFAEYGQPYSPYVRDYDHTHDPDFDNIVIEMPQSEVMHKGYGKNITTLDFPMVNHFLDNGIMMGDTSYVPQVVEMATDAVLTAIGVIPELPKGEHKLGDLIKAGAAKNKDRFITSNLYGWGSYGVTAGDIAASDAAYVHGTVSFALKKNTKFVVEKKMRFVHAEIGAGDDNWDFNSSSIHPVVNATVGTLAGPDHYNLNSPIKILFRGDGKFMVASKKL